MNTQDVIYTISDRVATLTLNRPQALNAWTPQMDDQVRKTLLEADRDDRVRVIVLTGAGRGFCAGADFSWLDDLAGGDSAKKDSSGAENNKRYSYFHEIGKPLIAAVNGPAVGLGLAVALYCDLRFASGEARFSTGFAKRGLVAEFGAAWLLPRIVGLANAAELLLTARMVDASEALRIGLVNGMFPFSQKSFLDEVYERATRLASSVSPRSVKVIKAQLYGGLAQTLSEALATSEREMALSLLSEDFREGIACFREKREPEFTGR